MSSGCSLRLMVKEKLLRLFKEVTGERKLIVLDQHTVAMVDAVALMNELLDTGAFLVESLEKRRQPYPGMQAIYFVAPESTALLAKEEYVCAGGDGSNTKRRPSASHSTGTSQYKDAYLLFSRHVPQEAFESVARAPIAAYTKAFQEIYVDFVARESRAVIIQNPSLKQNQLNNGLLGGNRYGRLAEQVLASCVTLNVLPRVRYLKQRSSLPSNEGINENARAATSIQEALDDFCTRCPEFRAKANPSGDLLVLDRGVDWASPLLHEFTYQAMVHDLVPIQDGCRYSPSGSACTPVSSTQTVNLDENDWLWVHLRHCHIAQCSKAILDRFNQFVRDNPAAMKRSLQSRASTGQENQASTAAASGSVASVGELREVMGALGEFQEMKALYGVHLGLAQTCMTVYEKDRLSDVALLEQDLACGLTSEGDLVQPKTLLARLQQLLADKRVTWRDKVRLVAIFAIMQLIGSSSGSEPERWTEDILDKCDSGTLPSLQQKARDINAVKRLIALAKPMGARAGIRVAKKREVEEAPFDVSRYTCELRRILQDACTDNLTLETFPFIKNAAAQTTSTSSSAAIHVPVSLRGTGRAGDKISTTTASNEQYLTCPVSDHYVLACCLNGATYAEIKAAYDVSNRTKKDCFVLAPHFITPNAFLDDLSSQGVQVEQAQLLSISNSNKN